MLTGGNENNVNEHANAINIIFIIKNTKFYVLVVTLASKNNQKLSKILRKGFERFNIFLNQMLMESIDCLFWFTQIIVTMLKDFMFEKIIHQKA